MPVNCSILMGRLTKDPDLSVDSSGKEYLRFTIAVDRPYSKNGERTADFIQCIAFAGTAVLISTYFKKGKMIAIQGHLTSSSYTDKDGNNRSSLSVSVDSVSFCGDKTADANTVPSTTPTAPPHAASKLDVDIDDDDDDSLPF